MDKRSLLKRVPKQLKAGTGLTGGRPQSSGVGGILAIITTIDPEGSKDSKGNACKNLGQTSGPHGKGRDTGFRKVQGFWHGQVPADHVHRCTSGT